MIRNTTNFMNLAYLVHLPIRRYALKKWLVVIAYKMVPPASIINVGGTIAIPIGWIMNSFPGRRTMLLNPVVILNDKERFTDFRK